MKKFLAIYVGSANHEERDAFQEDADRVQAGMAAWGKWMNDHANTITETGGPLGKTKRVDGSGISDTANNMTGYVIVEAATHEEAAEMFENHPHFAIFPGEAVEIMERLPIPGA